MIHSKNSYRTDADIFQGGLTCENREEKWCSCNTKLEKWMSFLFCFAILACVAVSTVLVLSLTTDIFGKEDTEESTPECQTEHCLITAAEISHRLKKDLDPCEDFHSFSCGRVTRIRSPLYDETSNVSSLSRIQERMEENITTKDDYVVKIAKMYFKSCLNTNETTLEEVRSLKEVIKDFGGWPITSDTKKTSNDFYSKFLSLSKEKGFSTDYILKVSVKRDLRNTSRNILYIEPPSEILTLSIINGSNSTYPNDQYKMALLAGAPDTNETKEMMKQIWQLEVEIANRSENYSRLLPITVSKNMKVMKLKELTEQIPSVDWIDHFKEILAIDKITKDTGVIVTDPEYLKFFETILENKTQSYVMNFLLWKIIFESSFYLTKLFEEIQKLHFDVLSLEDYSTKNEFCAKLVLRDLPYAHNYFINNRNSIVARFYEPQEVIRYVTETLSTRLANLTWMDDEMRQITENKIKKLTVKLGTDDMIVDKFYKMFDPKKGKNFFLSSRDLKLFKIEKRFSKRKFKTFSNEIFSVDRTSDSFYSEEENLLYYTYEYLGNIFKANRPNYIHFSRVGVVSAYLIYQMFGNRGRQYDDDGVVRYWFTNESLEKLNETINCNFNKKSTWGSQAEELQWTLYSIMEALSLSYEAYERWTNKFSQEEPLAGLNFTTQQLFWVSYAQLMCSDSVDEEGNRGTSEWHSLKARDRVNSPLKRLKIFSDDWNCQEEDYMYCDGTSCET